ncbi:MAG TPA: DUF4124 domain-containing protein, partial [Pseudomonadales bacterium]
ALLAGASGQAAAEEIYRWVDENGVVNYSQLKPRGVDAQAIATAGGGAEPAESRPAPAQPAAASSGQPLSPEQEKMLEGLRAAEQSRQQELAKIRAENCQQSRDVLARLTVRDRIRVRGEDGQYRIMPEDERQERISEAQRNVAQFCAA